MSFTVLVSIIGVGAGAFFAAALLVRDRTRAPETIYLAVASFLAALALADDAAEALEAYAAAPALYGFGYLLPPLFGPLVWLHVAARADPIEAGWRRAWPHLLGVLAIWLPLAPFIWLGDDRWRFYTGELASEPRAEAAVLGLVAAVVLALIQMTTYLIWAWRRANGVVDAPSRRWLQGLVVTAAIAWLGYATGLAAALSGAPTYGAMALTNVAFVGAIYGFALFALGAPPDPLAGSPAPVSAKYARSALDDDDATRLAAKANALVVQRQLHRDPSLTLAKLATAAGASPNDMSQALNLHAGGFHEWLSAARIADVQTMLRADPKASILDAAFAAGFNAKSTFYDAFRRATGKTPAAWRAALEGPDAT